MKEQPLATLDLLLALPNLDKSVRTEPHIGGPLKASVDRAIAEAYHGAGDADAHLLLQQILYRINRLQFFWYDDLRRYDNERSRWVADLREHIEEAWLGWENSHVPLEALRTADVPFELYKRAAKDVELHPSERSSFFRSVVSERGYRRLLEIFSLDALVEASQLSRTLGGVSNNIHAYMTRLFLEEYGGGKLQHKHSSYFTSMLEWFGMDTTPEAYFDAVPWEVLAAINLSFLLADRKRHYLRYVGSLAYTEVSVPASFSNYQAAAERLGMPPVAAAYWSVHIKTDKVHGRWMIDEIAVPLAARYPRDAWELLWGYEQQRLVSERAAEAIFAAVRSAQEAGGLGHTESLTRELVEDGFLARAG